MAPRLHSVVPMGSGDTTDVLVIEDHRGTARGLRALLVSRGYGVDVAMDASAAIERMAGAEYKLVVADWDLNGQDGSMLMERIKRRRPAIPLLVVTARDRKSVLEVLPELEIEDCLQKPVEAEALLEAVERHLRPVGR